MIASPLADVLEKDWQTQVVQLAKTLGYLVYHTHDSRRSEAGFFDLVIVTWDTRLLFRELKTTKGKLSKAQE